VLDAAGKPVADAHVVVLSVQGLRLSSWEDWASFRKEAAGTARTDAGGHFRLAVRRPGPGNLRQLRVVAGAPGHGLGWKNVDPDAREAEAELRLAPEQPVRGRLIDLQGAPVVGAKVRLTRVTRKGDSLGLPAEGLPGGFGAAVSDGRGSFTLHGLGNDATAELEVADGRFGSQELELNGAGRKAAESLLVTLTPAHFVEGRVTGADAGKPVAGCRIEVMTSGGIVTGTTDDAGRYRVAFAEPGPDRIERDSVWVTAYPPHGEGHLSAGTKIDAWPRGVVRRTVDLKAPRGVVLRGKVTEAGTGKPVAGARIHYRHEWHNRAVSDEDGAFAITVPEGDGHLAVTAPTPDYVPVVVGFADGGFARPAGDRIYYHAVVPVHAKLRTEAKEVAVALRRGVTIKGRLVGPDGNPVKAAVMFVGGHRPSWEKNLQPVTVHGGTFELRGCDPEKTYRVHFLQYGGPVQLSMMAEDVGGMGVLNLPALLDARNKLGAVAELSGKQAGTEAVVKLAPCGTARVRFLDGAGKPAAGYTPGLQLVASPGPILSDSVKNGTLAAEVVGLTNPYGGGTPKADADGRVTFPGLIPGATYRIRKPSGVGNERHVLKEFTVEAGKTAELEVKAD
jgi:hypothetical protein